VATATATSASSGITPLSSARLHGMHSVEKGGETCFTAPAENSNEGYSRHSASFITRRVFPVVAIPVSKDTEERLGKIGCDSGCYYYSHTLYRTRHNAQISVYNGVVGEATCSTSVN
jgi:hypothetical protein